MSETLFLGITMLVMLLLTGAGVALLVVARLRTKREDGITLSSTESYAGFGLLIMALMLQGVFWAIRLT